MDENEIKELKFSPAVFDPNKETLQLIAEEVRSITADPEKMTKEDLELINSTKNKLVKARTAIQKKGKEVRAAAIKFQKDVIAYEDELIGIIEPEEKRLKEIEAGAKEYAMKQERLKTLPEFKEKLASIGDAVEVSDEELLAFDPNQRDAYYNGRLQAKLEADRAAADAKRAEEDATREAEAKKIAEEREKIEAEKRNIKAQRTNTRIQRIVSLGYQDVGTGFDLGDGQVWARTLIEDQEDAGFEITFGEMRTNATEYSDRKKKEDEERHQAEIKEAAEKAKKEAEEKAETERKQAEEKRLAEEAAAKREAEEKQRKEKEEAEERTKAEKYNSWLKDNSYNAETDITKFENGVTTLYRKVSDFRHE